MYLETAKVVVVGAYEKGCKWKLLASRKYHNKLGIQVEYASSESTMSLVVLQCGLISLVVSSMQMEVNILSC